MLHIYLSTPKGLVTPQSYDYAVRWASHFWNAQNNPFHLFAVHIDAHQSGISKQIFISLSEHV